MTGHREVRVSRCSQALSLASSSLQLRKWLLKASLKAGLGTLARPAPRVPGEAPVPA